MILSICIPTFNRAKCLRKTLEIYFKQVHDGKYQHDVEFNISDNGSTDDTENIVRELSEINDDIHITYRRNEKNLGPDKNYIQAMKMARGDYSILWSDDDYLRDNALNFIVNTIKENPKVAVFISNRNLLLNGEQDIGIQYFINSSIKTRYYDFSKVDEAVSYFSSVVNLGGLFTYIPAIIYKTEVIELYRYDGSLDGTYYSFMYYWWQYLLEGRVLMYLKTSYIDCTYGDNTNFGVGINRVLVDYEGLIKVTEVLHMSGLIKDLFLSRLDFSYNIANLIFYRIYFDRSVFDSRLLPALKKAGVSEEDIRTIQDYSSVKWGIANLTAIISQPLFRFAHKVYNLLK